MPDDARAATTCVILAGGLSRRMGGGDKTLMDLDGRPMLAHVVDRVRPQVAAMVLNANADGDRFAAFDLPVAPDVVPDFAGPLAGVLTGLEWTLANHPEATHMLSVPADAPFLPVDLLARLDTARVREGADIAVAMSGGRTHPVCALWPVALAPKLRWAVVEEGMRKIDAWTARFKVTHVEWPTAPLDPFYNVNRPEDLDEARRMAGAPVADQADLPPLPDHMTVGVVMELRPSSHPWGEDTVAPLYALPGVPTTTPLRDLGEAPGEKGGRRRWCGTGLELRLFRKETEGYQRNLGDAEPSVYVVLRRAAAGGPLPMEPFVATLCPFEAQTYLTGGDMQVERVPMPEEVRAWAEAFVARNHAEEPFRKRKMKPKDAAVLSADEAFSRPTPLDRHRRRLTQGEGGEA
ncbi:molybdenum cofactor guanylyltransferase MobA [Novispirillum sp. DQ9]|uniref:molybdenum cofactor guanylyltransferase MobA n=1 Tax=Novispirillum sp. DQ9 TaxID=3398612 RepID=UPI003C7D688D